MNIVCDAGGTYLRFALSGHDLNITPPQKVKLSQFSSMKEAVLSFLTSQSVNPESIAAFLLSFSDQNPWDTDQGQVSEYLPRAKLVKINDFEANAWGVACCEPDRFSLLNTPEKTEISAGASKCVLGVGTGLGLAYVCNTPHGPFVQRTHGGHMLPSALDEKHRKMFLDLSAFTSKKTAIIYEDVLTGPGLWNMYRMKAQNTGKDGIEYKDTNDMIARGQNDPLVRDILKTFHEVLGIFAHQAVIFGMGFQGVYLTGGIIDRLMSNNLFDMNSFFSHFRQNGARIVVRDTDATPIYYIKDEFIALQGMLKLKP